MNKASPLWMQVLIKISSFTRVRSFIIKLSHTSAFQVLRTKKKVAVHFNGFMLIALNWWITHQDYKGEHSASCLNCEIQFDEVKLSISCAIEREMTFGSNFLTDEKKVRKKITDRIEWRKSIGLLFKEKVVLDNRRAFSAPESRRESI